MLVTLLLAVCMTQKSPMPGTVAASPTSLQDSKDMGGPENMPLAISLAMGIPWFFLEERKPFFAGPDEAGQLLLMP